MMPATIVKPANQLWTLLQSISPRRLARSNPIRQTIIGYAHMAGVESPYTFFAPNVPESLKVIFEIQFSDKRVIYDVPHVESHTEGLRLSAVVDQAAAQPGLWRDVVLQMLAASSAEIHPDANRIRVVVAALKFPRPGDYLNGAEPSYRYVCSYDFNRDNVRQPDRASDH